MADPNAYFFEGIRQDINKAIVEGPDGEALFVTRHSLEEIWGLSLRLEKFCGIAKLGQDGSRPVGLLKKDLLQTLSILVYIRWVAWDRFHNIFFSSLNAKPESRYDTHIEVHTKAQLEQGDFLGDKTMALFFIKFRNLFTPIVVEEGSVMDFKKGRPLPFMMSKDGNTILGVGAFGTVKKEIIAIKQYKHDENYNWAPYPVARKVLVKQAHFEKEVENLKELRKALLQHRHIAPFTAIISTGTEFNILSKLADMNLQEFIDGRHAEFHLSSNALMTEFSNLASALAFLHDGILIPGRGRVFCCHMDLKPENILVYKDNEHPVGMWKISDFGISTIKQSDIEPEEEPKAASNLLQVPSMLGDLKGRLTPLPGHTSAKRHPGTWQAPEAEMHTGKVVGRESDVWSLGCMFVPICALDIGGPSEMTSLQQQRGKTTRGDNYDDQNGDCFWRKTETGEKVLNPHIKSWAEDLPSRGGQEKDFLMNCQSLIFSALQISQKDRAKFKASDFYEALQKIRQKQSGVPLMDINRLPSPTVTREDSSNSRPESNSLRVLEPQLEVNFHLVNTMSPDAKAASPPRGVPPSPPVIFPLRLPDPITPVRTKPSLQRYHSSLAPEQDGKGKGKEINQEPFSRVDDVGTADNTPQPGNHSEHERQEVGEPSNAPSLSRRPPMLEGLNGNTPSSETALADTIHPHDPAQPDNPQELPLRSASVLNHRRTKTEPTNSSLHRPVVDHYPKSAPAQPGSGLMFSPPSRLNSMTSALSSAHNSSVVSVSESGPATKKMKFSPPNLKGVIQTIVPSSCEIIAFLSADAIYVYPIDRLDRTPLMPPTGCKWLSASISGDYILAKGLQMRLRETIFQVYEIFGHGSSCRPKGEHFKIRECEDGSISPEGYIMYQFQSTVWMSHIDSTRSPRRRLEPGETIRKSWFNESGTFAYIWSIHRGTHHIRAWKISDMYNRNAAAYFSWTMGLDDSEENDSNPVPDIIAFPYIPAFAVWRSNDSIIIVDPDSKSPHVVTPKPHNMPQLETLVIDPSGHFVICIRRGFGGFPFFKRVSKLCINKLKVATDGKFILEEVIQVDLHYPFQPNSYLSVSTVGEEIRVYIAHCTGKVEHYTLNENIF